MSTKNVAVCDRCGTEGALTGPHRNDVPAGWILTVVSTGDFAREADGRADFCCWGCVESYAQEKALR